SHEEIKLLLVGNIVAFVVALLAIKFFIEFLKKHGFRVWGIYRVVIGLILLALVYSGYIQK
ncbi:MAG: undecaprenyl-diphosphate phosphatase, partial [Ginsengibacter sp.]